MRRLLGAVALITAVPLLGACLPPSPGGDGASPSPHAQRPQPIPPTAP